MKETFRDSQAGDQLSASEYNKLKDAVERLAEPRPRDEPKAGRIIMVRILTDVVPMNSTLYTGDTIDAEDPYEGYNAWVQVWDNDNREWTDKDDGEKVTVIVGDDGQGWRPLVIDDIIPVRFSPDAQAYIPLEKRESAVVIVTGGPDTDGYYPGFVVKWDSDSQTWVLGNACYVMDVS